MPPAKKPAAKKPRTVKKYRALTSMYLPGRRVITEGEEVAGDDPAVKGREQLFELVEYVAPVERATAAPGEKRTTKKASE